tara:strand:+ start:2630 stop:2830 length:201 start_codon:yes stop_codon:yes gene_type:complete
MNNKYNTKDIIEAINLILNKKKINEVEKKISPLKLTNQVKETNKVLGKIPKDTEKIILQAEKYLKK